MNDRDEAAKELVDSYWGYDDNHPMRDMLVAYTAHLLKEIGY